jgi:hypothetical protein
MMKTSHFKSIRGEILAGCVFFSLLTLSLDAQNAAPTTQIGPATVASASSAKGIGPAPANTPQHQILKGALSPETRQTLQEAMNSTSVSSAK